jgi:cytochrome c-type biogenesis protein CcmH/NrfF
MMLPLAHAGHWLVWVLYLLPVVAVLAAVLITSLRLRRADHERRGGNDGVQ